MKKPPCDRGCVKRSARCHATCKEFKEWEEIHKEELEQSRKENDIDAYYALKARKRAQWTRQYLGKRKI